jgi:hypothetical protein
VAETERRRRRVRHLTPADPDPPVIEEAAEVPVASTPPVHDPVEETAQQRVAADDRDVERGLRGLVGSGSSQVSVAAALRARDAARPTDGDLAAAEAELMIIRRGWVPREELPRSPSAR